MKNHHLFLQLASKISIQPEVKHQLVFQIFENRDLESTNQLRLQNHPGYTILLTKSTKGKFQSVYQPLLQSKTWKYLSPCAYLA